MQGAVLLDAQPYGERLPTRDGIQGLYAGQKLASGTANEMTHTRSRLRVF